MSVISMPVSRMHPEVEVEHVADVAAAILGRFATVRHEDIDSAIGEALSQIAAVTGADSCRLLEFADSGAVAREHRTGTSQAAADARHPLVPGNWLTGRLARGETVSITRPDQLPRDAGIAPEVARRNGGGWVVGVAAPSGGRPICALTIERGEAPRRSPQAVVPDLQRLAEMFATALHRRRAGAPAAPDVEAMKQLNARLEADNLYLKEEIKTYHDFEEIVGESPSLRLALARLAQVAPMNSSVLLLGPTGTGKELFARALHERSRRHSRPLVRVNCAALPPTLVESELFGHEKGAFTGAVAMRQGRFELADGGSIFLDEIGDLAPDVQVKFLRVLQEGEFERVGSSRTRKVDVRVIAATHHDLEAAVAEGRFRADLYYRLSVYPIRLPSLQERPGDISRLAWFFINRHQRELGRRITEIPPHVLDALQHHAWPGNVRELENVMVRAMIASVGNVLELDAPLTFHKHQPAPAAPVAQSDNLDLVQRAHIEGVLQRCGWRINGPGNAAECLGVHPNTLRFRMKKLGLSRPRSHD